jgi:CRISPR/Cas system-associated exonuclease Cas4 (RecB family)
VSEAVQMVPAFDPAADLAAGYMRLMQNQVRIEGPSANTRASSIGETCERKIFYGRTVPASDRVAHGPQLQAIFELGKDFEKIAIRRLEDMGAEIVQRGRDYIDRHYQLSGHVDARIRMPTWAKALDCEIKGLNPYTGEKIHSVQDIRESRQVWVRKYYDQLQTYLLLHGEELGVFVLFNKSTGWPTFLNCPIDYEYAEGLLKKAERLKLAVATDAPPDRVAGPECQKCPFLHVCGPDIDYGKGAAFVDDAELEAKLRRMAEIEAQADEYAALEKDVKKSLPQTEGEYLIGEFVVVQKLQTRKAYVANVKASSFFKTDISRLTK